MLCFVDISKDGNNNYEDDIWLKQDLLLHLLVICWTNLFILINLKLVICCSTCTC